MAWLDLGSSKKYISHKWFSLFFFLEFSNFQIFKFSNSKFEFSFLNIANKIKMHTKENKMTFFFFWGLLTSAAPRADVFTGKAARVKVTGLNSGSRVKTMAQVPVE